MYLHLGQETVVPMREIVGIFDMENTTISKSTRTFLNEATLNGRVVTVGDDLPKSFIVCQKGDETPIVYISQISPATLLKRAEAFRQNGE